MKKMFVLLVAIICCGCSGKLYNKFEFNCLSEPAIETYSFWYELEPEYFREAMDVLYYKYPETHITLEILKEMEIDSSEYLNKGIIYKVTVILQKLKSQLINSWLFII